MPTADSLQALGISPLEESVYRLLLRHPGSSMSEISQRLGVARHSVPTALSGLEHHGLVSQSPGPQRQFFPVAPDLGMEALILRRQADLEQARTLANRLMTDFHQGRRAQPPGLVEIVSGAQAVHRRFEQLQRGAKHLVQVLDTPPYAGHGGTPNKVELEALARGVEYRGIYDKAALEAAPGTIDAIARYVAVGEQARFLPALPFKLATFDHEFGYVPLAVSQPDIAQFMVVRPCSVLDALLYIFDTLWERATPITFRPGGPGQPDPGTVTAPRDGRLLNLLATGMTDQAIAHHLGLSYRTARRRIGALMAALGAESRFQAGVQASRNGWLLPFSSPIPSTRGRRPVATSSRSPRRSSVPSNCSTYSSPSRRAALACIPSLSSIPSRRRASPSASPSGAASRGSRRSAPLTSTASPPKIFHRVFHLRVTPARGLRS